MRNFLIHEYFNINAAVIEDVVTNELQSLATAVDALLNDLADEH